MNDLRFAGIEQYKKAFGKQLLIVRPGVSLTMYSSVPLRKLGPHVAEALDEFRAEFPEAVLDAQLGTDKYTRLSEAAWRRLHSLLMAIPENYEFMEVHLKDGVDAQCGRYAFHFEASGLIDADRPLETNLLVFEWPLEFGRSPAMAERVVAFCTRLAATLPFTAATCGFAFQHPQTFPTECLNAIQQLMPRYLGFEPSYRRIRFRMRGHLPTAQWLTLVGPEMTSSVPQLRADALRSHLPPQVEVIEAARAVLLRSGELPFVGDSNRGVSDLGFVPAIARALQPWRYNISGFGGRTVEAGQWLARFDQR